MKPQTSETSSEYVIVETWQITRPPSRIKPPRRAGCFPVVFTVLIVHPCPNVPNLVRYKTKYEFWLNCDDFSRPETAAAAVNRLVDLMNVPFPLHDVHLFWKEHAGANKSGAGELPVADWNSMVARLSLLLRQVNDLVRKQEEDNGDEEYPFVKLQISKFVRLPKEELETAAREAARGGVNGAWNMKSLWRPQMEMEWRMAEQGGGGEGDNCGICWENMSVGSSEVIARLPCAHYCHERCILRWLKTNKSCPFCRFKIDAVESITTLT
nr:E3 ubiquitin-protein like [Ipomoea batatas]